MQNVAKYGCVNDMHGSSAETSWT